MQDYPRESFITKIGKMGSPITLGDGSRWNISIGDSTKTICWYETMRVTVDESPEDDHIYPYRMTNLDTSGPDVVRAAPK